MKNTFDRFAETNEPSILEEALYKARDVEEHGEEKSIKLADTLIKRESQRLLINLEKLNLNDRILKNDLMTTGKLLQCARILINNDVSMKIDIKQLHNKISERCATENREDNGNETDFKHFLRRQIEIQEAKIFENSDDI